MRIRSHPDVIEIAGCELLDILRAAVREKHGREIDQITWVNVVEERMIGRDRPSQDININATLKPESKA